MVPLARKNLLADKVRLPIPVGGVTFAVLLILVVGGLYRGFEREAGSFVESVPGDIWLMEEDTTDIFHSYSVLPEEKIQRAARRRRGGREAVTATPAVWSTSHLTETGEAGVWGSSAKLSGPPAARRRCPCQAPLAVVRAGADSRLAR